MDVLERIRRGYRALGPGAPRDVLAMFHQEQTDPPEWVVQDVVDSGHVSSSREVVAMDLFGGLPPKWEVTGVDVSMWDFCAPRSRLVVGGHFRTRPRGSWETMALPFVHVWSVSGEQVDSVMDYFAGIEVRRRGVERVRRRLWRRLWRRS
jgi:hypothetical protein